VSSDLAIKLQLGLEELAMVREQFFLSKNPSLIAHQVEEAAQPLLPHVDGAGPFFLERCLAGVDRLGPRLRAVGAKFSVFSS
jgi:hypothetical protein